MMTQTLKFFLVLTMAELSRFRQRMTPGHSLSATSTLYPTGDVDKLVADYAEDAVALTPRPFLAAGQ